MLSLPNIANGQGLGLYVGAYISLDSMGLVNIPGVTAEVRSLQLEFNQGFSTDASGLSVVDFSQSTYIDYNEIEQQGYAIETGDPRDPIVLMYDQRLITIQGVMSLNLFDLITLDAGIALEINESGMTLYFNAKARIADIFSLDAEGLLVIDSRGVAIDASLSGGLDLGPVIRTEVEEMRLVLNTTGQNIVYEVPEALQELAGAETITISNEIPGRGIETDFLLYIGARGSIEMFSILNMRGDFEILITEERMEMNLTMQTQLLPMNPLGVTGTLGIVYGDEFGMYGSLSIAPVGSEWLFGGDALGIGGSFMMLINTTSRGQTVRGRDAEAMSSMPTVTRSR